jgi:hypothetical protein
MVSSVIFWIKWMTTEGKEATSGIMEQEYKSGTVGTGTVFSRYRTVPIACGGSMGRGF